MDTELEDPGLESWGVVSSQMKGKPCWVEPLTLLDLHGTKAQAAA